MGTLRARQVSDDTRTATCGRGETPTAPAVPLLQELVLQGTGEAPPKTRILDECNDSFRAVNTYRHYVRREQPKVLTKRRPPVASFKEIISPAWLENHLAAGGYYRDDGTKALFDDVSEYKLFDMYLMRQEQREIPRLSTFLRAQNIRCPTGKSLNTNTYTLLTNLYSAFRDSVDYKSILEKAGENSELIKSVINLISHSALRKRLLKQREDGHPSKRYA